MYGAAEAFNASSTARVLISYKSIKEITEVYKFNVVCHSQVQTSMMGLGQRHTCRLYRQIGKEGQRIKDQARRSAMQSRVFGSIPDLEQGQRILEKESEQKCG